MTVVVSNVSKVQVSVGVFAACKIGRTIWGGELRIRSGPKGTVHVCGPCTVRSLGASMLLLLRLRNFAPAAMKLAES